MNELKHKINLIKKNNVAEKPLSEQELFEKLQSDKVACTRIEAAIELFEILQALPEQMKSSEDWMPLLKERDSYLDLVKLEPGAPLHNLMLSERPEGKNLLENLPEEFMEKLSSVKNLEMAEELLKSELNANGLDFKTYQYQKPVSREMRRIIRMEFNGGVNKPDSSQLSEDYAAIKERDGEERGKYKKEDYELENSNVWKMMSEFPNFVAKKEEIKAAMAFSAVPPEALEKMNVFDFEDVIFKYHEECIGDAGLNYLRMFEGSKEFKVKNFIRNHQGEFVKELEKLGVAKEDIEKTVDRMLKKGKIPVIKLPNGLKLKAEVHHEWSILDSGMLDNPTKVNDADNLKLVFEILKPKQAEQENNANNVEPGLETKARENKIELADSADLLTLANDKEAKQEYIKNMVRNNIDALFVTMKNLGVPLEDIKGAILMMATEGKMQPIAIEGEKLLGLNIKSYDNKNWLEFGVMDGSERNADLHHGILHGNSTRPVYAEKNALNKPTVVVSVEHDDSDNKNNHEKDAYAIELAQKDVEREFLVKRIMMMEKEVEQNGRVQATKSECYMGSLGAVIYSNAGDAEGQANRYNRLNNTVRINQSETSKAVRG